MVLTTCRSCGAEVSPDARVCPKCGAPKPSRRFEISYATIAKGAAILIGIAIVVNVVVWLAR